jgi:hypothetical protein
MPSARFFRTAWFLCELCGPLRLCAEYWVLKEQDPILNAKTQSTAKLAKKKGPPGFLTEGDHIRSAGTTSTCRSAIDKI